MNHTLVIRLGAVLTALLLPACAVTTPHWDGRFGVAVRATTAAQVANPAAARNPDPVNGIDGRAARAASERYERSFAQPSEANGANSTLLGGK